MQKTRKAEKGFQTYLRLSITSDCDLGCRYCVPYRAALCRERSPLSVSEIETLVRALAHNGVTKVRLTGGEPLIRDDVLEIVESIARIPGIETVGLTTNGIRLAGLAGDLKRAGADRVNISVDSLDRETFQRITGTDALDQVLEGLYAALDAGFEKVKVNTVVMRGINDGELTCLADLARSLPVDVRFIELMPLGHTAKQWEKLYVPASEIRQAIGGLRPLAFDGASSARLYAIDGGRGPIGIISPMSERFCGACNRIRVTSSGKLKPCLRLAVERDIRPWLGEPDLDQRLGALVDQLSCHKLTGTSETIDAVQAETMCSVGG